MPLGIADGDKIADGNHLGQGVQEQQKLEAKGSSTLDWSDWRGGSAHYRQQRKLLPSCVRYCEHVEDWCFFSARRYAE